MSVTVFYLGGRFFRDTVYYYYYYTGVWCQSESFLLSPELSLCEERCHTFATSSLWHNRHQTCSSQAWGGESGGEIETPMKY